ncbi:hypothetical protein ACFFS2_21525 [Streptomyces aurantiacus]|uniref:Secreted protein n=1 Tax=Streptomyces aurantiacus TaxID=47760 RepID=A0A7G1PCA1_9ACTN|nr:hypothetical protein [Streptomyces aurantiacus]BCL30705.1 hypothetical protein GCM10017557_55640 [Streptomyces aurantiacus]
MEAVVAIVALIFVLFVVLGAYATVKVVGAAKRGVDRTVAQARRTVEDSTLRAKTFAQPGAQGALAQLRLSLRTSMRATQEALHAGVAEDESLKESLALFDRLSVHGQELDGELKRLEREPNRARLAERLPALRERTEQITKSADALRWAARDRAERFGGDDLDSLSTQIDMEAGALRHWTTEPTPTPTPTAPASTPTPKPAPTRTTEPAAAPASPPWPKAPSADTDRQTWPESAESRTAEEPTRPAIDAPAQRPAYPWEKKPRPESTT